MYVDSKAKGSLVKMTACKDSDEKQYFSYTLKGQIMVSRHCQGVFQPNSDLPSFEDTYHLSGQRWIMGSTVHYTCTFTPLLV